MRKERQELRQGKFHAIIHFVMHHYGHLIILQVVQEWKSKADDMSLEVEASQKECRNYNSELFRLRSAHDEVMEQLDIVKRENKNLADEIRDLLDQLGDGGRYNFL